MPIYPSGLSDAQKAAYDRKQTQFKESALGVERAILGLQPIGEFNLREAIGQGRAAAIQNAAQRAQSAAVNLARNPTSTTAAEQFRSLTETFRSGLSGLPSEVVSQLQVSTVPLGNIRAQEGGYSTSGTEIIGGAQFSSGAAATQLDPESGGLTSGQLAQIEPGRFTSLTDPTFRVGEFAEESYQARFPISSAPATGTLTVDPPEVAQPTPTNLWEFYTQRGRQLPSLQERSTVYEGLGVGPAASYMAAGADNAAENQALLAALLAEERKVLPDRRVDRAPIPDTLRAPTGEEDLTMKETLTIDTPGEREVFSDAQTFYESESRKREQRYSDIERVMRESISGRQTERGEETTRLEEQYKVPANQARLDEILDLVAAETKSYIEARGNLQAETLPEGLSRGHLLKLSRNNLYKMEIFQAEGKALQGKLDLAEKNIDRAIDLKFFTDAQFLSNLNGQLARMERFGTAEERSRTEVMKATVKRQEDELKERKQIDKDVAHLFVQNAEAFRQAGLSMDEAIEMGSIKARAAIASFTAAQERRDIRGQESVITSREEALARDRADALAGAVPYTEAEITGHINMMLSNGVDINVALREVDVDPRVKDKAGVKRRVQEAYFPGAFEEGPALVGGLVEGFFENLFKTR